MMKRGISGRLKESSAKISGGAGYSAGGTNDSFTVYEGDARLTDVTKQNSESILKKGGAATNGFRWGSKSLDSAKTSTFNYESYNRPLAVAIAATSQSAAMAPASVQAYPEYSDVPVVIVEPYVPQSSMGDKVIFSATAYIKVKDAQAAYNRAAQIVHECKGFIGSSNFSQTPEGRIVAAMSLRVPREKFESILDTLRTFGDVKTMNSSNTDVSQQYQELTQQLANVKVIYDKLADQLKDKKTDVAKAEAIESRLTPYLHQIEGLRRQLASLDNQITMATIIVSFEEASFKGFLKQNMENIHEQEALNAAKAVKSLALLIPAFIAFVIALLCALAVWNILKDKFIKK